MSDARDASSPATRWLLVLALALGAAWAGLRTFNGYDDGAPVVQVVVFGLLTVVLLVLLARALRAARAVGTTGVGSPPPSA